jgi:hypothetical protein
LKSTGGRLNPITSLGILGLVLSLFWWLLSRKGRKPKWLLPVVIVFALIAGFSEMLVHFVQPSLSQTPAGSPTEQAVKQETKGDQSPAINTKGDVTVTYGTKDGSSASKKGKQ